MLISEARESFLATIKSNGKSPATIVAYSKDLSQLQDYLKNKNVDQISTEDLNDFLASLSTQGLTPKTISRKLNSIKSLFRNLIETKNITTDPSKPISHPTIAVKSARVLSETEYRSLRDAAKGNSRLATMIELMLQTGIRIGEISRIKLEDTVLKNTSGQILIKEYASSSMRIVELNQTSLLILKEFIEQRKLSTTKNKDQGYLFSTKNGGNINIRNIRSSLERIFKKAGIKNATVNDLRNTFIVEQLNKGVAPEKVSQIVGHKRFSSTEKYFALLNRKKMGKSMRLQEI